MKSIEYYSEIERYIKLRVMHPEDAEDLIQRVFLEYYQAKKQEKPIQDPKAYLFGTARILISETSKLRKGFVLKNLGISIFSGQERNIHYV